MPDIVAIGATIIDDAITGSDVTLDLEGIQESLFTEVVSFPLAGTAGDDVLTGSSQNDVIQGNGGNDTFYGGSGNDDFYGSYGDDVFHGGADADLLIGHYGDDTYYYNSGDGWDTLIDANGADDKIIFGAGIDISDISFTRMGVYDLVIDIDNGTHTGRITLPDHFSSGTGIETLVFDDTSTFDLTTHNFTMNGTAGNDTLYGIVYQGGKDDTIHAGAAANDNWTRTNNWRAARAT